METQPMTRTLDRTLQELAPVVAGALVSEEHLSHIARAVRGLPEAVTDHFGFECLLGTSAATADFSLAVTPQHGRAIIAGHSAEQRLPRRLQERSVWERLRRFCATWADPDSPLQTRLRALYLEFDLRQAALPVDPVPSVFLGTGGSNGSLHASEGTAEASDSGHRWAIEKAIPLLRGAALPPPVQRTVALCVDALPDGAAVAAFGLMLARPTDAIRICLVRFPMDQLPAFLERIGWQGPRDEACAVLSTFARGTDHCLLALDAGHGVGPRLGLEYGPPSSRAEASAWAGYLNALVAQGLCIPAKRDALLAWPDRTYEPKDGPIPAKDVATLQWLHGFRLSSIFVPHIDHLKVSYQPGRPLEAKAYIGLMLRWGVAWDALSSVGGMWASPLRR
jgi:hypothetical protein